MIVKPNFPDVILRWGNGSELTLSKNVVLSAELENSIKGRIFTIVIDVTNADFGQGTKTIVQQMRQIEEKI